MKIIVAIIAIMVSSVAMASNTAICKVEYRGTPENSSHSELKGTILVKLSETTASGEGTWGTFKLPTPAAYVEVQQEAGVVSIIVIATDLNQVPFWYLKASGIGSANLDYSSSSIREDIDQLSISCELAK